MSSHNKATIDGISIRLESNLNALSEQWNLLEQSASLSLFQNFDWNHEWVKCFISNSTTKVQIILGYNSKNELQFILPFQIKQKFGFYVLEWLAQSESSYGIGIYNQDFLKNDAAKWFSENFATLIKCMPKIDVIKLEHLPLDFEGNASPLNFLNKFEDANCSYSSFLNSDFEALLVSKRGPTSLKSMRKRDRRLRELGQIDFTRNAVSFENLTALLHCKEKQLAAQGIFNIFNAPMPRFFLDASKSHIVEFNVFELHLDGKIISSMLTAAHQKCFYPLIITMAHDGPLQVSPGDVLLRHAISWACEKGLGRVDFSLGRANFKEVWADKEVLLFNYVSAINVKGLPLALAFVAMNFIKRKIKKSQLASEHFNSLRQRLFGR